MKRIAMPILIVFVLFLGIVVPGVSAHVAMDTPLLSFSSVSAEQGSFVFGIEEPYASFPEKIVYTGLSQACITLDGKEMEFAEAIQSGVLTHAQVMYYARQDAANGHCKEWATSENGLSTYHYTYPEVDILICQDVLELPSGETRLVTDLSLSSPQKGKRRSLGGYLDPETGKLLTCEDWGVAFAVDSVSPTCIQLTVSQSGGQQLGQLTTATAGYLIYPSSGTDYYSPSEFLPVQAITMEGQTVLSFDWEADFGALAPGSYVFRLYLTDEYDEESVHSLMRNYTDNQNYDIPFTVP